MFAASYRVTSGGVNAYAFPVLTAPLAIGTPEIWRLHSAVRFSGEHTLNMEWSELLELLWLGRFTTIPLAVLSVIVFGIAIERLLKYRGLESATRELTRKLVDCLVRRDLSAAPDVMRGVEDADGRGLR